MKDRFSVHLNKETHKKLKLLSVTSETPIKVLVDKAVRDLLKRK